MGTLMTARVFSLLFLLGLLAAFGCGASSAKVKGRVTCRDKPVVGLILFSPKGEDGGKAVNGDLKDDGSFEVQLPGSGKYSIVVTPRDVVPNPRPGQVDYPCERSLERDIKPGDNDITIELPPKGAR
jgi:hypothetical protein